VRYLALIAALMAATASTVQASRPIANATRAGTPMVTTWTDGREGGKLDFRTVKVVQPVWCAAYVLTVSMWTPWSFKLLPTSPLRGKNRLTMLFDRNRDGKPDDVTGAFIYAGLGDARPVPTAVLRIIQPTTHSSLDPIGLERPTPASAWFRMDYNVFDALMGNHQGTQVLRVAFTSVYGTHRDRIPNHGWIRLVSRC
jgi:hypothetical protein